ncbi:MAG: nicotinate-nucleotide adenylyltransferase [Halanaerobiales bacterium]|nr:nicotinate-nucleotide adenylyltransferase [Halanaerobiales bacterium]
MRFAIMGGTYDPVHLGHLICAERAYLEYNLDKVIFMIAGNPPHKKKDVVNEINHRYNMLKLVVKDNTHFNISDYEISKNEKSYTADTIKYYKNVYNINRVNIIIGTDSLADILNWYKPEYILNNSNLIVAKRNKYSFTEVMKDERLRKYEDSINLLENSVVDISSSMIRELVKNNKSIKYLTLDKVIDYIYNNNLYRRNK